MRATCKPGILSHRHYYVIVESMGKGNGVGLKEQECKGLGFCASSCTFLSLTCLHMQKRPTKTKEVPFFS